MSFDSAADPVREFLENAGVPFEIVAPTLPTTTVPEAAIALGCSIEEVVKTLLFTDGSDRFVVAIATGLHRVDKTALANAARLSTIKLAPPELVLQKTGFSAGSVPPIALPAGIPMIVDARSAMLGIVFAGAGRSSAMLQIAMADIVRLNQAVVIPITQPGGTTLPGSASR